MARRKKGRDVTGWLIVDKPAGWGSTDVVNKVRWAFEAKKAGHAGTLDPAATGLLAVALGEATKVIPLVTDAMKAYDFTIRWGEATETDDAEGAVMARSETRPDRSAIEAALPGFTGRIMQVPPAYSAVKVAGERAYDMAREGERPEIAPRPLLVESLTLEGVPDSDHATLHMICGKGGYVRSIARDLGEALGCFGHVTALRRIWSGPFDVEGAVRMEEIERLARTEEIDSLLRPIEAGLDEVPRADVTEIAASRIRNGNPAEVLSTQADFGDTAWAAQAGRALAIGHYRAGHFHPSRVLNIS